MTQTNSYIYFAFIGENFNPAVITEQLGIEPSDSWQTGDTRENFQQHKYSYWKLVSTGNEILDIDKLVTEVISKLKSKVEPIKKLKKELNLDTIIEIVMYVDINEEQSTPFFGHDSETIAFLHTTGTTTDVDIYKYDSTKIENVLQ